MSIPSLITPQFSETFDPCMRQKKDPSLCQRERHIYHHSMVALSVNLNSEDLKYSNPQFINKILKDMNLLFLSGGRCERKPPDLVGWVSRKPWLGCVLHGDLKCLGNSNARQLLTVMCGRTIVYMPRNWENLRLLFAVALHEDPLYITYQCHPNAY